MVVEADSAIASPQRGASHALVSDPEPGDPAHRFVDAWREGTRARAAELRALNEWMRDDAERTNRHNIAALHDAVDAALDEAVNATRSTRWFRRQRTGARMQAAIQNLDAAETDLLQAAPTYYLLGQMPSVINDVQRHLKPQDARRREVENIFKAVKASESPQKQRVTPDPRFAILEAERTKIVSALRGARSASLREQIRLRSFRNLIVATTLGMTVVALMLGIIGWRDPAAIPLCFGQSLHCRIVTPIVTPL